MTTALTTRPTEAAPTAYELALVQGDLSKLSADERLSYYRATCSSLGLNPLTKPFEYITLNGKLTLYAKRDATDQLRNLNHVTVTISAREREQDVYIVTARATLPDGRSDESIGAVTIGNLKGDALANALMKAETKAKRRVTLSICGLGWLDETEIETIPASAATPQPAPVEPEFEKPPRPDAVYGGDSYNEQPIYEVAGVHCYQPKGKHFLQTTVRCSSHDSPWFCRLEGEPEFAHGKGEAKCVMNNLNAALATDEPEAEPEGEDF